MKLQVNKSEISANSSSTTLSHNIFSLNENSTISRDIEDAALHIIRQKMAQEDSNTIEFKSGELNLAFLYNLHNFEIKNNIVCEQQTL